MYKVSPEKQFIILDHDKNVVPFYYFKNKLQATTLKVLRLYSHVRTTVAN